MAPLAIASTSCFVSAPATAGKPAWLPHSLLALVERRDVRRDHLLGAAGQEAVREVRLARRSIDRRQVSGWRLMVRRMPPAGARPRRSRSPPCAGRRPRPSRSAGRRSRATPAAPAISPDPSCGPPAARGGRRPARSALSANWSCFATGSSPVFSWTSSTPAVPQLLLQAAAKERSIALPGRMKRKRVGFSGVR